MLTGKDDLKRICINPSEPLGSQLAGESCKKERDCVKSRPESNLAV